jgi:PAS domain S-box-containing protein
MNAAVLAKCKAADQPARDYAETVKIDALPLAYVEVDAHGIITRANRAAQALNHLACGELIGKMAWDLMATDEKDRSFAAFCSTLESDKEPAAVLRSLYDRSGQFRTYEIHRALARDGEGRPTGMHMVCVDVTEANRALEEATRASLRLKSVLDSMGEAVIVTDSIGFIQSVNPAAEMLLGWKAHELNGVSIEEGLPIVACHSGDSAELTFNLSLERAAKGIATVLDRERHEIRAAVGTSPIFDKETGSISGVVLVVRRLEKQV